MTKLTEHMLKALQPDDVWLIMRITRDIAEGNKRLNRPDCVAIANRLAAAQEEYLRGLSLVCHAGT